MKFNKPETLKQLNLFLENAKTLRKIKQSTHMSKEEKFEWAQKCAKELEEFDCYQEPLTALIEHQHRDDFQMWQTILTPYKDELDTITKIIAHPDPDGFKNLIEDIFPY